MFSPYYKWARRGGRQADPLRHCTLNVALYGRRARWAMTERGAAAVRRDATHLAIGPSQLHWDGDALVIRLRERGMPLPRGIRGEVRVHPAALTGFAATLDHGSRHRWRPMAPRARVDVALDQPSLRWSGIGYLDSNDGDAPLEAGFRRWDWCRAPLAGDATAIVYDTEPLDGADRGVAIHIDRAGAVQDFAAPPRVALPPSRWRLPRGTRSDSTARILTPLVDAPFYARSAIDTGLLGQRSEAVHESVDLRRFTAPWTQAMLPFRMPRRLG